MFGKRGLARRINKNYLRPSWGHLWKFWDHLGPAWDHLAAFTGPKIVRDTCKMAPDTRIPTRLWTPVWPIEANPYTMMAPACRRESMADPPFPPQFEGGILAGVGRGFWGFSSINTKNLRTLIQHAAQGRRIRATGRLVIRGSYVGG